MGNTIPPLAIYDGFWGQVIEVWPFAILVTITVAFAFITLVAELVWRLTSTTLPGASPRIEIPRDPNLAPKIWLRRGRDFSRIGSWTSVGLAILFLVFANNTPGIGADAYYVTRSSPAVVAGAGLTLGAALVGLSAALYLHRRPRPATVILSLTTALVFLGPALTTWNLGWLGVMTLIMGIPVVLILLGIGYTLRGLTPNPVH
jgi:uncharacterized membrane protein